MDIDALVKEVSGDYLNDDHIDASGMAADRLWPHKQLVRYANEAIIEACKRAPLIKRAYKIPITAGIVDYAIDPSILQIYDAQLISQDSPLEKVTEAQLDTFDRQFWRTRKATPHAYIRTKQNIKIYPIPVLDDSLVFSTSNIPDDNFDFESEIEPDHYRGFQYYIAYKAYLKEGPDTKNLDKANGYLKKFDDYFGRPKSAKYLTVTQNSPMYGGVYSGRMA